MGRKGLIGEVVSVHELGERHAKIVPLRHSASQAPCAGVSAEMRIALGHTRWVGKRNFIAEWRKTRDWSQERLASEATELAREFELPTEQAAPSSWGRTDVTKYEKGTRDPPLAFLRAAAALFHCTVDDLLARDPASAPKDPPDLKDIAPVWRDVEDGERERALAILRQFRRSA